MEAELRSVVAVEAAPAAAPPERLSRVEGAQPEARRNAALGSTAAAANPEAALTLAQEALLTSRQATAALLAVIHAASDLGAGPEAAAAVADEVQAQAEAIRALGLRLARLARGLHQAAGALRPAPEQRRVVLAENLQRYKETHQALLLRAEAMLAGGPALSPHHLVAAETCGLGHWRRTAALAGWGDAAFAALEAPHQGFHRALAGLLFAHQQRQAEAVSRCRDELEAHMAALATALEALCASILRANDPAVSETAAWSAEDEAALVALRAGGSAHGPTGLG